MQLESILRCKFYTKSNSHLMANQMLACVEIPFATRSLHIIWCNSCVSFGHQTLFIWSSDSFGIRFANEIPANQAHSSFRSHCSNDPDKYNEANICDPSTSRQVIIPKFHFFVPSDFDRKPMCEITSPIRNDRSVAHFRFYYFGA